MNSKDGNPATDLPSKPETSRYIENMKAVFRSLCQKWLFSGMENEISLLLETALKQINADRLNNGLVCLLKANRETLITHLCRNYSMETVNALSRYRLI